LQRSGIDARLCVRTARLASQQQNDAPEHHAGRDSGAQGKGDKGNEVGNHCSELHLEVERANIHQPFFPRDEPIINSPNAANTIGLGVLEALDRAGPKPERANPATKYGKNLAPGTISLAGDYRV
jgi:hypothetical protein